MLIDSMIRRFVISILSCSLLACGGEFKPDLVTTDDRPPIVSDGQEAAPPESSFGIESLAEIVVNDAARPNMVSYSSVTAFQFREADTQFEYGDAEDQFGQYWLPTNLSQTPLLIFIHGGCWSSSFDYTHARAFASAVSEQGIAVALLEFRRSGQEGGGWPGTLSDITSGLAYMLENLPSGIDRDRVILSGHSSGGHLALLAGSEPIAANFKGVMGLAAITDLPRYANMQGSCPGGAVSFIGARPEDRPDLFDAANPLGRTLHPLSILLHGDSDTIVPLEQAEVANLPVVLIEGAGHFDFLHPETSSFQVVLRKITELLAL